MQTTDAATPLRWYEHILLAVGIFEIPLQIDKYFLFHERDADLGAVGGINISITTIAFALLYVFWIGHITSRRTASSQKFVMGLPMLFYIGTVGLSTFAADNRLLSLFDLALLGQAYLIYLYIANRVRTRFDLNVLVGVFFSTVIFQSLLMFGLKAMGESMYDQQIDIGPLALVVWDDGRPAGSMHSAVLAGSYVATLWMPAMAMFLTPVRGWLKWVVMVTVVVAGLGILINQSRGAILTTAIGTAVLVVVCLSRGWLPRRVIGMGLVLAVIGAVPMVQVVQNRVIKDDQGSAEARIHLAQIAIEMIQDKPIAGFGAGNCHNAAQRYADQFDYRSLWYYTVHNKYLLVWIETGLLGLVGFLVVLGSGIRDGLTAWFSRHRILAVLGIGISVAIFGQSLHMFVDIFNSRTQVQSLWALLGLATAVRWIATQAKDEETYSDEPYDSFATAAGPYQESCHA